MYYKSTKQKKMKAQIYGVVTLKALWPIVQILEEGMDSKWASEEHNV